MSEEPVGTGTKAVTMTAVMKAVTEATAVAVVTTRLAPVCRTPKPSGWQCRVVIEISSFFRAMCLILACALGCTIQFAVHNQRRGPVQSTLYADHVELVDHEKTIFDFVKDGDAARLAAMFSEASEERRQSMARSQDADVRESLCPFSCSSNRNELLQRCYTC
eukprot:m.1388996 g.1388996  ORF g.1388996 m.1388996 type:complete len:163 (-) comp24987_c0_seq48:3618-4106(-)